MLLLLLVLALAAVLPDTAAARGQKPKPTPCVGTYVIADGPIVGAVSPDTVILGATAATGSGCPAAPVKLKATKKATLVTAKWSNCTGITGKASLKGKITGGCATFRGVFRAKKSKLRRNLTASRSTCGDGILDTTVETCEAQNGCAVGQFCRSNCTCSGTNCGPNAPQAMFVQSGTLQAGQPVMFDGGSSSDADGDSLVYAWQFGDGQRGGGARVAHIFAAAGARTVRLTVSDGCGHTATHEQTLDIAAGPSPTNTTAARGRIRDVGGQPISGAQVHAEPGGSATSNGAGDVTVTVGQGVSVRITVGKAGYAEQVILTEVPDLPQPDAYFEATLLAREPATSLADAAAGGTVGGKHGSSLALPPNALIDGNGDPVTGAIEVGLTPVDIIRNIRAFPGRAVGLSPDGTQGPIVTYGTVEFALTQGDQLLNLAPGTLATIQIPIYATKNLDGSPVAPGQPYPLWSLDPQTAQWVEEGQGTVVVSSTSPSGLALRGQVTHFSFWNCDSGRPPYKPRPKCLVDTNADGVLEDLTGTAHCWHAGTGPEQEENGFQFVPARRGGGVVAPQFPNWIGQVVLPAAGGTTLPVPADMDIVLQSRAQGGLLQGSKLIRGPVDLEEDVIVVLRPVNVTGNHITIPFEAQRTISSTDSLQVFDFDGTAGQTVFVTVEEPGTSVTAADVTILLPDDSELGPVEYRPIVDRAGRIGLVLPNNGNYRIVVTLFPNAFAGDYRIRVGYTGSFPIILSTNPTPNATGVPAAIAPTATFSQTLGAGLSFDLFAADAKLPGNTSVVGAVATFTPSAQLIPGAGYRAEVSGFRSPGESSPNGFPSKFLIPFNVAETAGTLVPIGTGRTVSESVTADADGNAYAVWSRVTPQSSGETWGAAYRPGIGWSFPQRLAARFSSGSSGTAIAAVPGGVVAVWPDPDINNLVSVKESRYTVATGWSEPVPIENQSVSYSEAAALGADATGNLIALFGTGAPAGQGDIFWSRFTAGGSWSAPDVLFDDSRNASIAMNSSGHAVAIAEKLSTRAALVRRYVPGQGWSAVDTFEVDWGGRQVSIDASGNAFVLLTTQFTPTQHRVRRYDVNAQAWSSPVDLQASAACHTAARIVAATGGYAFVVGCRSGADPGVFAVRYTPPDGGNPDGVWGAPVLLASGTGSSFVPSLGVDASGNATAFWMTGDNGTGARYRRFSTTTGWEASAHEVPGPGGEVRPVFAVGGTGAAVAIIGRLTQSLLGLRIP
jgi:PKD domain/Bacterial Ig-like domain